MDYRDFQPERYGKQRQGDQKTDLATAGEAGYWWKQSDEARGERFIAAAEIVREMLAERSQANLRHARLYGNFEILGFNLRDYTRTANLPANRITLNVVASTVDTLTAKIAKTRPRPSFLTSGGNYRQQRAARRLDKFCRGLFYEGGIYDEAVKVFVDGCVLDIGALKILFDDCGKLKFERVFPEEIWIDDVDGMYGRPRQLIQRRIIPKEVLLQRYGDSTELAAAINQCKQPPEAYVHGFGDVAEVFEGWHLPSGPGAGDGCHVIAIRGKELFYEKWDHDYFPFAFFRFSKRMLGFWGQSLTERLSGIQLEINRLLRSISEQLRRKGRGRIFVPTGSKVAPSHLTNNIADIVFFTPPHAPVVDNANAVAPEEFQQLDRLYQRAFQEAGLSELSASSKKPSGLDAAVAIREFLDVESDRFAMIGREWENLFMCAADIAIDMIRTSPDAKSYRTQAPRGRYGHDAVEWKDVDLERDAYIMQMFPVSSLPQTPAYRLQRVEELKQGGYIDQATAHRLLEFPDIEAENTLAFAAMDDVDAMISDILDLDKPKFTQPDEFSDLTLLIQRGTAAYLRAKHWQDIEPERLDMLIRLIDAAHDVQQPTTQPAPPAGPPGLSAPPPGPGGAPMIQGGVNNIVNQPPGPVAPPVVS